MKSYGLNELREMFLRFFETKEHLRLPSFSLIPQDDASLLLINSGMAPMKPYFKGDKEPPRHRICTCQKCIRTGDIENIGKTARHGTYFEMLGNFSFGDYFKHEAIAWSWEFLTSPEWVGLDPERLYPSVYEKDDEAFNIWRDEIGIPERRITRLGKEDNFWEHGSGPCGPCSEIYFDRGEEYGCGKPDCAPGCDCDRYMEVWNNVFSQFDNDGNGNYSDLIQKNIDTGMGLERLAVVCQGVDSLFDVDTVMNITHKVSEITGAHYGDSHKTDVSLRVITDHIRASVMMISDGILPSNEGRGYVLRRLLRRAARHGKLLGVNEPFLYQVVDVVVHENECQYPELREKQAYITRVIRNEEENFAKTIDAGMHIFSDLLAEHKAKGERVFSGADAFKLYDTYGFPIDLTREMVQEQDMTVDEDAFRELMEQQRVRARKAREALGDLAWAGVDLGLDPTPTQFTGYDRTEDQGTILAIVCDGEVCSEIDAGKQGVLVLDCTPFYAEMGGQVADHGVIAADGALFEVTDVQKDKAGKFLHHGVLRSGRLQVEQTVTARIDVDRRKAIMRAHSATHLLQAALREVLGDHVHQAGSLVEPDRLRFDLTHFSAVTPDELQRINEIVSDWILDGMDVTVSEMTMEQAKAAGATALFSEKYGDVVRVVNMGGKSVAMKTVALNVLLLQAGFLVCAKRARMPLFHSVKMLFDDLQSIQSGLSGFGSEIVQFQKALDQAEQGYSLFLLDEFARGTNPDEGAVIVQAVTKYLNEVNAISLLTTHYDKVAENARLHYQIIGLRDVDPEQIRQELAATGDDGIQVIARHMNYGLYRVEGKSDCPRDALNICRMLSLKPEILEKIEQAY